MGRICQLACSRFGSKIAAAEFDKVVSIWDLKFGKKIATFDTVVDYGGKRLMIDDGDRYCVAASYDRSGIECYLADDGHTVWKRPDLTHAHYVRIPPRSRLVCVGFEDRPVHLLDLTTGNTVDQIMGAKDVHTSPFANVQLLEKQTLGLHVEGKPCVEITRASFGVLDVGFGPDSMCVSESGKGVRCFTIPDARQVWEYLPPTGSHVTGLSFDSESGSYYAVLNQYASTSKNDLLRIDADTGMECPIASLGVVDQSVFCLAGRNLLTTDGKLYEITHGTPAMELEFQ